MRRSEVNAAAATNAHAEARPIHEQLRVLMRAQRGPAVVTIGTFDGVHAGHRALLTHAAGEARRRGVRLVAVTFSPRPDAFIAPEHALPDICPIQERTARLRAAGADAVVVLPFTRELMGVDAAAFVGHLVDDLGAVAICVGSEFALGRGRAGTVPALRELGIEVIAVPVVVLAGRTAKISSSSIRRAIDGGVPRHLALTAASPVAGDLEPLDERRCLAGVGSDVGARFTLSTA